MLSFGIAHGAGCLRVRPMSLTGGESYGSKSRHEQRGPTMILRLWRGWTTAANADAYEELIRSTIFPGILDRGIDGLFRLDLYRRAGEAETEFMTTMWFTNHEAIARFAGPDWETAVVPASARALLSRFDEKAAHYESRVAKEAAPHL
jgi:hypothetical protein